MSISRRGFLGGLGSSGGVGNFCAGRDGLKAQGRVFDDVLASLRAYGAYGTENGWHVRVNERWDCANAGFDHNSLPFALHDIATVSGVEILYATPAVGVAMDGSRIDAVRIGTRKGLL